MNISRRSLLKSALITAAALPSKGFSAAAAVGMKPNTSVASFENFLAQRQLTTSKLTIPQLVESNLAFYRSIRCLGLSDEQQSDMLLFQWGVFDWGKGPRFEFDITRQFISAGKIDDDAISQFRCTAYFAPTAELRAIPVSNRWCDSVRDLDVFSKFILGSAAYRAVRAIKPSNISTTWGLAG